MAPALGLSSMGIGKRKNRRSTTANSSLTSRTTTSTTKTYRVNNRTGGYVYPENSGNGQQLHTLAEEAEEDTLQDATIYTSGFDQVADEKKGSSNSLRENAPHHRLQSGGPPSAQFLYRGKKENSYNDDDFSTLADDTIYTTMTRHKQPSLGHEYLNTGGVNDTSPYYEKNRQRSSYSSSTSSTKSPPVQQKQQEQQQEQEQRLLTPQGQTQSPEPTAKTTSKQRLRSFFMGSTPSSRPIVIKSTKKSLNSKSILTSPITTTRTPSTQCSTPWTPSPNSQQQKSDTSTYWSPTSPETPKVKLLFTLQEGDDATSHGNDNSTCNLSHSQNKKLSLRGAKTAITRPSSRGRQKRNPMQRERQTIKFSSAISESSNSSFVSLEWTLPDGLETSFVASETTPSRQISSSGTSTTVSSSLRSQSQRSQSQASTVQYQHQEKKQSRLKPLEQLHRENSDEFSFPLVEEGEDRSSYCSSQWFNPTDSQLMDISTPGALRLTPEGLQRHDTQTLSQLRKQKPNDSLASWKKDMLVNDPPPLPEIILRSSSSQNLNNKNDATNTETEPKNNNSTRRKPTKRSIRFPKITGKFLFGKQKKNGSRKNVAKEQIKEERHSHSEKKPKDTTANGDDENVDDDELQYSSTQKRSDRILILESERKYYEDNKKYEANKEVSELEHFKTLLQVSNCLPPCVVCKSKERTHIAIPCMHFSFCEDCVKPILHCPVCSNSQNVTTPITSGCKDTLTANKNLIKTSFARVHA